MYNFIIAYFITSLYIGLFISIFGLIISILCIYYANDIGMDFFELFNNTYKKIFLVIIFGFIIGFILLYLLPIFLCYYIYVKIKRLVIN